MPRLHRLRVGGAPLMLILLCLPWVTLAPTDCGGKTTGEAFTANGWQMTGVVVAWCVVVIAVVSLLRLRVTRVRALRALSAGCSLASWGVVYALAMGDLAGRWWTIALVAALPLSLALDLGLHLRRPADQLGPVGRPELLRVLGALLALLGPFTAHTLSWTMFAMTMGVAVLAGLLAVELVGVLRARSARGLRALLAWQLGLLAVVMLWASVTGRAPEREGFSQAHETRGIHTPYVLAVGLAGLYVASSAGELVAWLRGKATPCAT